ncbi:unnamed protein product [Protopolystoma xenopodis]|uniref:3'(2'),5'-bisphosphate nucleotidase n=1 Tax=Protopolystoma xenopodis TaxID=117903 RepID=A0A448XMM5_9PLAT|nr:unnamed protein product [Protopolystoma xenopodis]
MVGHVTVLIGIAAEGRPVGGVIAQPFYVEGSKEIVDSNNIVAKSVPRIIWSFEGMGLHGLTPSLPFDKLQNTKLPFPIDPSVKPGDVHHTIVTTRSHPTALVTRAIEACSPTEV